MQKFKVSNMIQKIGFPRTGNTFVNYILKNIIKNYDGKAIKGKNGHLPDFWNYWENEHKKIMIFNIRNYKECIGRNLENSKGVNFEIIKKRLLNPKVHNKGEKGVDYIALLELYDKYKGPKILIYYEDLIINTKKEIQKLFLFLKNNSVVIDNKKVDNFLENLKIHKNRSMQEYSHGTPKSNGEKAIFHSLKIKKEYKSKLDNYLKKTFPKIFNQYLKRYQESKHEKV